MPQLQTLRQARHTSGRAMRPGRGGSVGWAGPGGLCSGGTNSGGAPGITPAAPCGAVQTY